MADRKDTFLYLATCSHRSLGDFKLSRLERYSRLKKDVMLRLEAEIDKMADELWEVRLASLFDDHGAEIMERLTSSPQTSPPQKIITSPFRPIKKQG